MAVNLISSEDISIQQTGSDIDLHLTGKTGDLVVDSIRTKNMLNKSIYNLGYYGNDGTYTYSTVNVNFDYIKVESNTEYVFSASTSCLQLAIIEFDSNKTFIKRNASSNTNTYSITTSSTTKYVKCQLNYNNALITNNIINTLTLQFELGNTPTTYSGYQSLNTLTSDEIVNITNGDKYTNTPLRVYLPNNISNGGAYGTTQYMKIGYIKCDFAINQNKSNISILVSSCFYDVQHWSTHILTIGQASTVKGNKLKLGGNDRTFYYLKDTTNGRINIYAYCSGGNGYGDWCTQVIGKFGCDFVQEFAYNITYSSTWTEITAVS